MLNIEKIELWPPLVLAPMAGLTHSALRTTILDFGGVGLLSTEMLSAVRLPAESIASPYMVRTKREFPLAHQVLLANECEVAPSFRALARLGAEWIDINLGCPAPNVRRLGGGSSLAEIPDKVRGIVRCARSCTDLPLSAKIRLGERLDASKLRDFCVMLVDEGVDLITVHARLHKEPFSRQPRWEWVGKVKQWVTVPVIANGGIDSVTAARSCLEVSGADGLMIGRAAAVTPWLFAEIARELFHADVPAPQPQLPLVYTRFCEGLMHRFRPERRLGRLKEFTHYFAKNYFFGHYLAAAIQSSPDFFQAWARAVAFFQEHDRAAALGLTANIEESFSNVLGGCNNRIAGEGQSL